MTRRWARQLALAGALTLLGSIVALVPPSPVGAAPGDSPPMAIWRRDGQTTPSFATWDGSDFGATQASAGVGDFRIMQGAEAPTRNEAIVVGVDASGTIAGERWDGATWAATPTLGTTSQTYWWGAEVAYESSSGDAMVVYADGTALNYRTWDGSTWSAEAAIPEPPGGTPRQIRLAADPTSNEMVVVVSNDSSQDYAVVWDGSAWGNGITLDATGSGNDRTDVYVAYEQQSGEALVVYGAGNDDIHHRTWNGTSWESESILAGIGGGYAKWTTLGADPGSDRIGLGVLTNDADVWFTVWDGSGWTDQITATTTSTGTTELPMAIAFESTSGRALASYGATPTQLLYRIWTEGSGWSAADKVAEIGTVTNSMVLESDPATDDVMLVVQDDNSDLHWIHWDGLTWGADNLLETDSGETKNQPFLFLWNDNEPTTELVVNSTGDGGDANAGNGVCETSTAGECTLRAAIEEANGLAGTDTISFDIPQSDGGYTASPESFTIRPSSLLPAISTPMVLDASTQPEYTTNSRPVIEVDGVNVSAGEENGFYLTGGGATLRGFAINNWGDDAIDIEFNGGNTIVGNYIGTNVTGTAAEPNAWGINFKTGGNTIGGTTAADRNVVSGNTYDAFYTYTAAAVGNVVQGNYVGTNATGTAAVANGRYGLYVHSGANGNTIGGATAAHGNVISGNVDGIYLSDSDGNVIQGNFIGTNVTGDAAIPNTDRGIQIESGADNNIVGGNPATARNLISGNGNDGVTIADGVSPGSGATGNIVQGNYIGVQADGTTPLGNGAHGVHITTPDHNRVGGTAAGAGNVIANNTWTGVQVQNTAASGNSILRNSIYANGGVGIDLGTDGATTNDAGDGDTGPNDRLNFPEITSAVSGAGTITVTFDLDVPPNPDQYRVEFFTNPSGTPGGQRWEGETFLSAMTTAPGTGLTHAFAGTGGEVITATATRIDSGTASGFSSTSEISDARIVASSTVSVNSTGDAVDATPGDALCDTGVFTSQGQPECTLRAAIQEANLSALVDTIHFAIPTSDSGHSGGVWTLSPTSELPTVDAAVSLDGSSQPGFVTTPVIEIEGSSAGAISDGLRVFAADVEIRGLSINRFQADGIEIDGTASDTIIVGNHIGVDPTGLIDRGNGIKGVNVQSGSSGATIGGSAPADRNIISGNGDDGIILSSTTNNVVIGNYIGTDITGNTRLENGADGVVLAGGAANNTIGQPGAGNVLSGNANDGFENDAIGPNNTVQANTIGLGVDGSTNVFNGRYGVVLYDGANNTTIGGSGAGDGNVISGNADSGVLVDGNSNPATTGNTIAGNLIGTDATGTQDRGNGGSGIHFFNGANGNTIGGPTPAHGNVISGNFGERGGVYIVGPTTSANRIQHNYIGTNRAGDAPIPNNLHGVDIDDAPDTQILDNLISGNDVHGVYLHGTDTAATQVLRNVIGTNAARTARLDNLFDGVRLETWSTGSVIGTAGDGNVISGNTQHGVSINSSNNNIIQGNWIGTDPTGLIDLGNGLNGVYSDTFGSSNNLIGGAVVSDGNVIAFNASGVALASGLDNAVVGNTVYANDGLGIDLEGGTEDGFGVTSNGTGTVNDGVNFPVIAAAAEAAGTVTVDFGLDVPAGDYRIEVFTNQSGSDPSGHGEGESLETGTTISHGGTGFESFQLTYSGSAGGIVTLTATEEAIGPVFGSTSEFSQHEVVLVDLFLVNSTGDQFDNNPGDGTCDTGVLNSQGQEACTLRAAIQEANAFAGSDQIRFNMPSSEPGHNGGIWTIAPSSPLPPLATTMSVDATSQPGYAATPIVELRGDGAGADVDGLLVTGDNTEIRGLAINRFDDDGIQVNPGVTGTVIAGNHIGTDPSGTIDLGHTDLGIDLQSGSGSTTVGGIAAADRNLISGNGDDGIGIWESDANVIIGNYIGTDVTGNAPLPNTSDGIALGGTSSNNTIGQPGAGNVLSGNGWDGIEFAFDVSGNVLQANMIGLGADGTMIVPNARHGVVIYDGANNTQVGGTAAGEGNTISGNTEQGVHINANSNLATVDNILEGNRIGTDVTGLIDRGNGTDGVRLLGNAQTTTIGGTTPGAGNVISGNGGNGAILQWATDAVVAGNVIGLGADGSTVIPNTLVGVRVEFGYSPVIGGNSADARNVISGNGQSGIQTSGDDVAISGNYIGTDATGLLDRGNNSMGIHVTGQRPKIGGAGAGEGNVISGNTIDGIQFGSSPSDGSVVGNLIGVGADGVTPLANGSRGIAVFGGSNILVGGDAPGAGNVIMHHPGAGVSVDASADNISLLGNSISNNLDIGFDLNLDQVTLNDAGDGDSGPNGLLNHPEIVTALDSLGTVTIEFDLDVPAGDYRIEVFTSPSGADASGYGEGEIFETAGTITHAGAGTQSFQIAYGGSVGDIVTLTATSQSAGPVYGPTSEFSASAVVLLDALYVNSTGTSSDNNPGDGRCDTGGTNSQGQVACSLRAAIQEANAFPGSDFIYFNMPATESGHSGGIWTTGSEDPLPTITSSLTIDGTTQPGFTASPVVQINGASADEGSDDGLRVTGDNVEIRGLAINRFPDNGIQVDTGASGTLIAGNYIGTDPTGTLDRGNNGAGINLLDGANSTIIGGATPADRNVISGNGYGIDVSGAGTDNNVITGNYVGTDGTGTADLGNASDGIAIRSGAQSNVVGGPTVSERNIIAGNDNDGVWITGVGTDGNVVRANWIGYGTDGSAIANSYHGIAVENGASNNMIGGDTTAASNRIGNSLWDGVAVAGGNGNGNSILGNSIVANTGLGIDFNNDGLTANDVDDLDAGPNDQLNYPVISTATQSTGTITVDFTLDVPAGDYRIEFFTNPSGSDPSGYGEGESFVHSESITHPGAGSQGFAASFSGATGQTITATSTLVLPGPVYSSTSEFSKAATVIPEAIADLSGSVMEDVDGDGDVLDDGVGAAGVEVAVFFDQGNGEPDNGDSPVTTVVTNASGDWSVTVNGNGTYWVAVDSTDLVPAAGFNAPYAVGDAWADQTYGSAGAVSFDGSAYGYSGAAGAHFGGKVVAESDDFSSLATAEHIHRVEVTGADVTGIESGFSFQAITNTADSIDPAQHQGSLRQFIENSEALVGVQASQFVIPKADPGYTASPLSFTITPVAGLPTAADRVIIDGTTQSGFAGTPIIELDGSLLGAGSAGLTVDSTSTSVRGLVINRFDIGISIVGGADNIITGNYLGPDVTGLVGEVGNNFTGLQIANATGTVVGGTGAADRNVISGNRLRGLWVEDMSDGPAPAASGTQILGNYIGTDAVGLAALPHDASGATQQIGVALWDGPDTQIGGPGAGEANVISGNEWYGIYIWGPNATANRVQGNVIGLDQSATSPVGNGADDLVTRSGVYVSNAPGNLIGGTNPGEGNIIAGNHAKGVIVHNAGATDNSVLGNQIYGNAGIGLDLDTNGVTTNDALDADSGANDLLNFPDLTQATAGGGTVSLDVTVDIPAGDYRIEFFANPSGSDPSGHGEGEVFRHAEVIAHPGGGAQTYRVSFAGAAGDVVSATTTELLAGPLYGSTSEFSGVVAAASEGAVFADSSERRSDLDEVGTVVQAPGKAGIGARFSGAGDRLVAPPTDLTSGELTLSAWVNATGYGTDPRVVAKTATDGDTAYELLIDDATAEAVARIRVSGSTVEVRGGSVPTGTWHQLVATWDGSTVALYIDGSPVASAPAVGVLTTDLTMPLVVGNVGSGTRSFNGTIDHVRVSHTARTAEWITASFTSVSDPGSFVSIGGPQTGVPGPWTVSGTTTRNGSFSLSAPETVAGADAWATAIGIDEPGVEFEAWWQLSDPTVVDAAGGTRTGAASTDQNETALAGSMFDLGSIVGGIRTQDATSATGATPSSWVKVVLRTDETGSSSVWIDDTMVIGPTPHSGGLANGSVGLRIGELPSGETWHIDDVQLRRLVSDEPVTSLGPLDRN